MNHLSNLAWIIISHVLGLFGGFHIANRRLAREVAKQYVEMNNKLAEVEAAKKGQSSGNSSIS